MPIDITITGLDETRRKVEQVATDLHGRPMLDGMRQATLLVERDAKRAAPVDTGRLRASIASQVRVEGTSVTGVVGSNVVYAAAVELGSRPHFPPPGALSAWASRHGGMNPYLVARAISRRGTRPRHFLKGAFEQNKARITRILGDTVSAIVRK